MHPISLFYSYRDITILPVDTLSERARIPSAVTIALRIFDLPSLLGPTRTAKSPKRELVGIGDGPIILDRE